MDNAEWSLRLAESLEQLRNSLTEVSLMLKDYQANLDLSDEGKSVNTMHQALTNARRKSVLETLRNAHDEGDAGSIR